MKIRIMLGYLLAALIAQVATARAVEDPGRAELAMVRVTVYHATDADPKAAGDKALSVPDDELRRLTAEDRLRFSHYRLLGRDSQPVLRSYESWAEPLKPSDEVLVRFEAQGHANGGSAVLDLELWLSRKKIIKVDARLESDKPLYLLGPEWRGGRLIIAVELVPKENPDP
jgi:hypothetical protein